MHTHVVKPGIEAGTINDNTSLFKDCENVGLFFLRKQDHSTMFNPIKSSRITAPERDPHSGTCEYITSFGKRDFADVIKRRILRQRGYP